MMRVSSAVQVVYRLDFVSSTVPMRTRSLYAATVKLWSTARTPKLNQRPDLHCGSLLSSHGAIFITRERLKT